jgi:hypothetical protein
MWSALMQRAALAHLVAGFVERQPLLVQTALQLFDTVKKVCPSSCLWVQEVQHWLKNASSRVLLLAGGVIFAV